MKPLVHLMLDSTNLKTWDHCAKASQSFWIAARISSKKAAKIFFTICTTRLMQPINGTNEPTKPICDEKPPEIAEKRSFSAFFGFFHSSSQKFEKRNFVVRWKTLSYHYGSLRNLFDAFVFIG